MSHKSILFGLLGTGFVILLIILCCYTVNNDEYVVITVFGKPAKIHTEPGLYVKWPTPFAIVNRMDRRVQPYETPMIEYLTGDKKNLLIKTFVFWKISDPLLFFQATHHAEAARQKLDDVVCSLVASTLGDHQMNQIISTKREDLAVTTIINEITTGSQSRIKPYGIEIDYIGFSRLALPDDNTRSVYRRMIAERSSIANEYRAQGRQRATEIRAEADKQRSDILAVAYRDSEIIRGEADAEAAVIYGKAYSENPEFFRFMRTLETEKKILGDQTTVILSTDSELFAPLEGN